MTVVEGERRERGGRGKVVGKQVGKQAIIRKWTNDQEGFRLRSRWRWEVGGGRWEMGGGRWEMGGGGDGGGM